MCGKRKLCLFREGSTRKPGWDQSCKTNESDRYPAGCSRLHRQFEAGGFAVVADEEMAA
jgi:hypothetical protein